jgi:plastocyanin
MNEEKTGYGKRPLWQWIVLYVVIGGALYWLAYYVFFAGNGGYNYGNGVPNTGAPTYAPVTNQATPPASPAPVTPASPERVSVAIKNFAFSPNQMNVKAGTEMTWTNNDNVPHTVTSDSGAFESGTLRPGGAFSFVFKTSGTFSYHCAIHPSMTATVVVTQ